MGVTCSHGWWIMKEKKCLGFNDLCPKMYLKYTLEVRVVT